MRVPDHILGLIVAAAALALLAFHLIEIATADGLPDTAAPVRHPSEPPRAAQPV